MWVDPELEEYHNTWALVDINIHVNTPAEMLGGENSSFFLILVSSPRMTQLQRLQKYGQLGASWVMKPFTLSKLIQA